MISEIPTMAVQWIDVHNNTSVLFDEIIAHRVGLIPLKFEPDKFNFTDECKCGGKGCSLCQAVLFLDKKGPCTVYSGDLKSTNKNVGPIHPGFPIVELLENQNLKFEAVCRLGIGKNHAKHHASIASYQYYPEIEDGGDGAGKYVRSCPKHILAVKGSKVVITDPAECDLCRACEIDGLKIRGNPNKFIFRVESVSGLKNDYIVLKASQILQEMADEFRKEINKL
jgi:DNA-directed RNA polymerase subunit D